MLRSILLTPVRGFWLLDGDCKAHILADFSRMLAFSSSIFVLLVVPISLYMSWYQ